MYNEEYKRWMAADLEDADLKPELSRIEGNEDEIKERFAVALKFGTAGLRGVLGAGTNRMNIYVVRQATQGLANWVKTQGGRCAGGKRYSCTDLRCTDAGTGTFLCDPLLQLQRRNHGNRIPQSCKIQRLQGIRSGRLPDDR